MADADYEMPITYTPPLHIVAAGALVTDDNGHVLMIKSPRRGWEFPGGQIEEGESLIDGLSREILEETGITAEISVLVGVYTNVTTPAKVMFGFLALATGGIITTSAESEEVAWVPRKLALARVTHPAIKDRLQDKLAFSGQVMYRVYSSNPYQVISERYI